MAFEIGEIVFPVVAVTFSGEIFDLTETSGTVINRQQTGTDLLGEATYLYEVDLFEDLVVGSGNNTATQSNIWLTDAELGAGEVTTTGITVSQIQDTLTSAITTVSTSKESIDATLASVNPVSSYYDDIKAIQQQVAFAESFLISQNVTSLTDTADLNRQGPSISGQAANSSISSQVAEEITDNLFGFYTLVNAADLEAAEESAQAQAQEVAAQADDEENLSAFYQTYVSNQGSKSLLTPSESESTENLTDVGELTEDGTSDPDYLIGESLNLEQD